MSHRDQPYYHVIRSSKENLDALETLMTPVGSNLIIRPTISSMRRTRKGRPELIKTQMFPGYAFIDPSITTLLQVYHEQYPHNYLKSPTEPTYIRVPKDQLDVCVLAGIDSKYRAPPLPRMSRVRVKHEQYSHLVGTVQECVGHHATVWFDGREFPSRVLITDVEVVRGAVVDG